MISHTQTKPFSFIKKALAVALLGFVFSSCGDSGNIKEPPVSQRPPLGVTKIDPLKSKTDSN